ncbi:ankyrin, partial [Lojkania enalia]
MSIYLASAKGHREIVQCLLNLGSDLNIQGGLFDYPLNVTCIFGYSHIAQLLLDHGCGADTKSTKIGNPLEAAVMRGHLAAANLAVQHGTNVNTEGGVYGNALQAAAYRGLSEVFELLLQRSVDLDATGYCQGSPLQTGARFGHFKIAKKLIDVGAKVDLVGGRYQTAVRAAVTGEHIQMLELLVKDGANVNLKRKKSSLRTLQLAIQRRNLEIVQCRLQNGADVNDSTEKENPYFVSACAMEELAIAELLIASGADVNAPGRPTMTKSIFEVAVTPLHITCHNGSTELVKLLVSHGANVNTQIETQGTPLQAAATHGKTLLVDLPLELG